MKTYAYRIIWKKYLFLILTIMFLIVDVFLFYSLKESSKTNTMLNVMAIVVLGIDVLLFVFTILNFIKKKDAVIIDGNTIILNNYKKVIVELNKVIDIKYLKSRSSKIGTLNSGRLEFYLQDSKKIYVNDIRNVKNACQDLRNALNIK